MTTTSPGRRGPVSVCLATRKADARLVIRATTAGRAVAYPMLVIDRCPFADPWSPRRHSHVHYLTDPGMPWIRIAPCSRRRPYALTVAAS